MPIANIQVFQDLLAENALSALTSCHFDIKKLSIFNKSLRILPNDASNAIHNFLFPLFPFNWSRKTKLFQTSLLDIDDGAGWRKLLRDRQGI